MQSGSRCLPVSCLKAKRYLQLELPGNFETTQQIAFQLVPVALYGLPLDYYNNYVQNIEAITQADVAARGAAVHQSRLAGDSDRG